ncbi:MAG TPA: peptide MFS transporter [Pyrinomonadaceae bacterium]|jgi:POT family proton-dependent oligopeptide transporter
MANSAAVASDHAGAGPMDKHPKGLYVLFATEMWERFSFYSMLAMFTLYLRDPNEGFGWTAAEATSLYANYLMFVYLSPLVGGFIADRVTGYRKAVMIGGLFFIAGHLLLSLSSLTAVYAALTCLVIGNGFFKPNVSTMVGNLYPEGSHLKDRAYNIFYMGINIGAFLAPLIAGWVRAQWGFHPAFAVAAGGMVISVWILFQFKKHIHEPSRKAGAPATASPTAATRSGDTAADTAATAADAPPHGVSHQDEAASRQGVMDAVPEWKRIVALCVIFAVVIVFWMVFHQNASTLTYFADANTDWTAIFSAETAKESGGIISNSINPFWVITLTFPLVWFWGFLDRRGLEPSTPTKMAFGMTLTGLSFFILFFAARAGEAAAVGGDPYAFRVSPLWLITSYFVVTLGELMLSPMGLSLVSKVAPIRLRGLMMGGWFVATAMGNKLTQIGVFWDRWLHSSFFAVLGTMALVMAVVLFLMLKPLKKAMPGV